jgi:class 3 adenylate cyclase
LRIGIHIGDVIIEDGDIFGDGVRSSMRLSSCTDALRSTMPALDLNGTARRVHGTCELNQNTVARPLDDAPPMLSDFGF